jgi:hypothetical protein
MSSGWAVTLADPTPLKAEEAGEGRRPGCTCLGCASHKYNRPWGMQLPAPKL